jgi:hypothetical protein
VERDNISAENRLDAAGHPIAKKPVLPSGKNGFFGDFYCPADFNFEPIV